MRNRHTVGGRSCLIVSLILGTLGLTARAAARTAPPLLDTRDLAEIGLRIAWQRPLPLRAGECLAAFSVLEDRLLLRTTDNGLIGLRRHDGGTIFLRDVGPRGFEVRGWEFREGRLLGAVGEIVTVMAPETATLRGAKDFGVNLVAPPLSNAEGLFLAGRDHRVHAIGRQDHVVHYRVGTDSGAAITALTVGERDVVVGTDTGELMALRPGPQPIKRWEFRTQDAVAAPLVLDGSSLFVASRDTHVYRLELSDQGATLAWRTQCAAQLTCGPWVTSQVVYQCLGERGVTALDRQTGAVLWTQPDAEALLAEAGPWAYLWAGNRIVVMDNAQRRWAHLLAAPTLTTCCTNTVDAEIYLADDQGRIVCLAPVHN